MAVNGAPRSIQPRNTPIWSSQTSNSRSRENRLCRSSEGNETTVKSIASALTVPSTRKRVRSYSLQDSVRRMFAIFFSSTARLAPIAFATNLFLFRHCDHLVISSAARNLSLSPVQHDPEEIFPGACPERCQRGRNNRE